MFTGIIQEIGRLKKRINQKQRYQLTVEAREITKTLSRGDSIAVNGVCLTVVDFTTNSFTVDVMPVTLDQTNLGRLNPGACLNLEPAVSPRGLLGGHLVTGHIDDIGLVRYRQSRGNSLLVDIEIPSELTHLIVDKGSIALNG
ncbi:MAG: riboflavin synthase, partial [Bacillota bacterium]